ncbi:MAG: Putative oxidoreductase [uncultured Nocardioidaceae bacterium]|uniref:Oxidoreductase n=2 Tax=uncultured Nocardioidaceae bacterium TaxID=253824 RepID=A0A6J4N8U6_9ACTN|nr:MAG: Putative oxidoreductase [uncultured Nocardioidaceae bacterium]
MRGADDTVFERRRPAESLVEASLRDARDACFWIEDVATPLRFPPLRSDLVCDLAVVGGGYTGLWTAIRAKQRDPGRRVVLVESRRLGWAASGRNGGFCAASLTHGEENGRTRWPSEYATLERLGTENLDAIEATVNEHGMRVDFERSGELSVAVEPHQVGWLQEAASSGAGKFLDRDEVRAEVDSPTYLAGLLGEETALLHPAKMVDELARVAADLGVEIFEDSHVLSLDAADRSGPVTLQLASGAVRASRVALGTNAFPALVRRYRPYTVPVYDYAVMTEPLTRSQLDSIGWRNRQGIDDAANQFHYYRLSADDRILFGGYDAVYRGKKVRDSHEHRPATHRRLGSHLLTTFPQLEGIGITHRWAGAIDTSTRFCAFYGLARQGRVAHAAGFTGLGVGATRFAADVLLDLLDGLDTERTGLEMVRRKPLPFPPEPLAAVGIQATRWSLDRADHRQGRRNAWLRTLDRFGLGFDS